MKYILDREGVRIPSTRLGSGTAEKSQKLLIGMSGRGVYKWTRLYRCKTDTTENYVFEW